MPLRRLLLALPGLGALLAGCVHSAPPPAQTARAAAIETPATQPVDDPRARLPLDEVPPAPKLASRSASDETGEAPIEAVQLFAQARIAILDNERYTAINLLEKAASLDPQSFLIQETLGRLYLGNAASDARSIDAYERAASIDPDHLDLQITLGRQYLAEGKLSEGIRHLLLALQTHGYRRDESSAAEADLFLGTALRQQSYYAAALTLLERLSSRMQNAGMAIHAKPSLRLLLEHPEEVSLQIGELHQKLGENQAALDNFMSVAATDPSNLDLQQRLVEVLAAMGRRKEAVALADRLVLDHQGHGASITVLRIAEHGAGGDEAACQELERLYAAHPSMRSLLFAELALLRNLGRVGDADALMAKAVAKHPDDMDLAFRHFRLLLEQKDRLAAVGSLIDATAHHPEWEPEAAGIFEKLLQPSGGNRVHLDELQRLPLSAGDEATRLFWLAQYAAFWHRDGLSHQLITQATSLKTVYRPAYRMALEQAWEPGNTTTTPSAQAIDELLKRASVDKGLESELRGLIDLHNKQGDLAVPRLGAALKLPGSDADVQLEYAEALRSNGNDRDFESAMWKLLSDHPLYHSGYNELYGYYAAKGLDAMCDRVVSAWITAEPESPGALRLQARDYFRANRPEAAEAILNRLLSQYGDDAEVLGTLKAFFQETGRPESLPRRLEDRLARSPGDLPATTVLAELYTAANRPADARRVVSAARNFAAGDPDVLYMLSGLFARIDQKAESEAVLRQVLALEPAHPAANNDLGYLLTEDDRDLPEAQTLVRRAVSAEPFNVSFLDSLGWVLYKLSRFDEARLYLERATTGEQADPVVLNHLGDNAYRLGDQATALRSWKHAAQRLASVDPEREDLKGLLQQLQQKQQQLEAGRPVDVAPVSTQGRSPQAQK